LVCVKALAFLSFLLDFFDVICFSPFGERVADGNLQQPLKNDNLLLAGQGLGVLQGLGLLQVLAGFLGCHGYSPCSELPPWAFTQL
jgi:hypothetical protein